MTRVDEFNSFYSATSAKTLQVAYALSGDRQVARQSTIDAYRRAWRDWAKIHRNNPIAYVRTEAWKIISLNRGTHLLRRKSEDESDAEILTALSDMDSDDRRLIVLLTLGDIDLEEASKEVGIPAEEGIERVTTALTDIETRFGQSIDVIEGRLHELSAVTATLDLPSAGRVRSMAKQGQRRNTVALVAVAVLAIIVGGLSTTEGDVFARNTDMPTREKIGAERPDAVLNANNINTSNLLKVSQVKKLDPTASWKIAATDTDPKATTPYATCPVKRFSDPDPLRVFVRTYETSGKNHERVAQAIEVSRSAAVAEKSYRRLVEWYSNCEHPRVQLVDAYTVKRPFGDFQILRLTSYRFPQRTFTVGFSHSGTVTSTLVHEIDAATGPNINTFARTLNDSVTRVCSDSGGICTNSIQVLKSNPPATSTAPEFLGIVDLPPVALIDKVWAGTDPVKPERNPAATPCDNATFTGTNIMSSRSRVFLIPEATELPTQFGVAETVARFDSAKAANDFITKISSKIEKCPKTKMSASIDQNKEISAPEIAAKSWRIAFEVDKTKKVYYRTALIRRGADVAQVTFTSAGSFDMSHNAFEQLAIRAGQRLVYLN